MLPKYLWLNTYRIANQACSALLWGSVHIVCGANCQVVVDCWAAFTGRQGSGGGMGCGKGEGGFACMADSVQGYSL